MLDNSKDIEIIRVLDDICDKIEENFKAEENVIENESKTCDVPKKGFFYEHDNRLSDNFNEDYKQNNRKPRQYNRPSIDDDKWEHDLFDVNSQGPKSFKGGYRQHTKLSRPNFQKEEKDLKKNEVNSTQVKKQNSFHQERRNEDLNAKSKKNYDYNNNKKNFVSLEVANTRNNYNYNQKHVKIDMQENKQNLEAPKKSYFLNRRKQQQKDHEENHNKSLKTLIPHSKSDLTNLNYLNNENNHAYDDENNLINLTKSLSFSNSKYKKNDAQSQSNIFDTDDDNDYKKRDNQDFIKYQSEILKQNQIISSKNYLNQINEDQSLFNIQQQQTLKNLNYQQILGNQRHLVALPPGIELAHILRNQKQHQYMMNQSFDYQNFGFQQYYNNNS